MNETFVSARVSISLLPQDAERLENLSWELRLKKSILLRKAVIDFLEKNTSQESTLSLEGQKCA